MDAFGSTEKSRRSLTVIAAVLALLVCLFSCSADGPAWRAGDMREQTMVLYPRVFADWQHSSSQAQTTSATGEKLWFVPNQEGGATGYPAVMVVTEAGLTVQYGDRFRQLRFDGTVAWEIAIDPGLAIFADTKAIYYLGPDLTLQGMTFERRAILGEYSIPRCGPRGSVVMVQPRGNKYFLMQTYNRAREMVVDDPPESDSYHLMLKRAEERTEVDWLHDFEGSALPGLVTHDNSRVVLLTPAGRVTVFDIASGKTVGSFDIPKAGLQQASLDHNDQLVILLYDAEAHPTLVSYSLAGERRWSFLLPPAGRRGAVQPPAIGADNRAAHIWGDTLWVVAEGALKWRCPVPPSRFAQHVTLLGDNSLLLTAANAVLHLDADGALLFETYFKPEEQVTTPAVVDGGGRIYVGTTAGIHCLN